jgi:tripartite-type tricarboxylate transporter receptor subunit TctC
MVMMWRGSVALNMRRCARRFRRVADQIGLERNMKIAAILALLTFTVTGAAAADSWPAKPLRMLTAELGGGSDLSARLIATGLSGTIGQQVIVDNRVGGVIIADIAAKSAPDGYTLFTYSSTLWLIPFMRRETPYDPVKDFTAITQITGATQVLIVSPQLKASTLKEFIALAQANPRAYNYGSGGNGSPLHVYSELFSKAAKVSLEIGRAHV